MRIKKRVISCIVAAAMMLCSAPMTFAESDTVSLDPRSALGIGDGYIKGIVGIPTVDELSEEFDGEITVISPNGDTLAGDAEIPADSTVKSGDTEIAKVAVPGDAGFDGKVNLTDASAMLKYIAAWNNAISTVSADVDLSGAVNLSDVSQVLKYIAGWDVTLGGEYLIDVRDGYKLLANDSEFDAQVVERVKEFAGIDLEVITEAAPGDKFITFGRNLHEKYDFIDADAVAALENNTGVADDGLYIDTYGGNIYLTINDEGNPNTALQFLQMNFDLSGVVDIYRGYCGTLSDMNESAAKYQRAVRKILETEPAIDGTNGMNGDILTAITNAEYVEPKNIIYMIGDGMGKNITIGATYCHLDDLYGGKLAMNYLPVEGRQSTYSTDQQITDSAAGGTALATGMKTSNGTISKNADDSENYKTLVELAAEKGKSTGVIATKSVTDATPATFTAHVNDRGEEIEIANQQLEKLTDGSLDLILGGGYDFYNDAANAETLAAAKEAGVTYTNSWDEAAAAALPVAGIFTAREMSTDPASDEPHIAAMTDFALDRLSEDEDGFFLMVEGSKIDTYGHGNDFGSEVDEAYEFDCAVAVALRYVALNPDTVLVITADHETGELSVPAEPTPENIRTSSRYSSGGHHWVDVPVYAVGYGTEVLGGNQENTDVAIFLAELMGEENFGQKSEVFSLMDVTSQSNVDKIVERNDNTTAVAHTEDGINVVFGTNGIRNMYIPGEVINTPEEERDTVTAFRVTYTNMSDTRKYLPGFGVKMEDGSMYTAGERITYISPGETVTYTYNVSAVFRHTGSLASASEVVIYGMAGYSAEMLISDISVVSRPLDK